MEVLLQLEWKWGCAGVLTSLGYLENFSGKVIFEFFDLKYLEESPGLIGRKKEWGRRKPESRVMVGIRLKDEGQLIDGTLWCIILPVRGKEFPRQYEPYSKTKVEIEGFQNQYSHSSE